VVAVVSGRPASFLAEHLAGAGGTELMGLYGLETARAGSTVVSLRAGAELWRQAVGAAADDAEAVLNRPLTVERKGLTVALHYRADPSRGAAVERLAGELARRHGLQAHPGKMSFELRPPVEVDKGTVLAERAAGLSAVAFAGDDIGDLPAFETLRALRAAGVTTLSVASGGGETPPEVERAADLTVGGPDGIIDVLGRLAAG
jgi:trehalose 6-phosphate phosphatase